MQDIITLTQIAAPSFQEATRAAAFLEMARAHGLEALETDAEGNVTGLRRGIGNGPLICVAAHLDTVFPAGTDLTVRREGTRLFAPGVGDDTRSLAVLLAWLRAMDAAGIRTRADILFVADVGEEGPGDLRGMRHLFQQGRYKDRISAFITVDSPDMDAHRHRRRRFEALSRDVQRARAGTATARSAWSIRCMRWRMRSPGWAG